MKDGRTPDASVRSGEGRKWCGLVADVPATTRKRQWRRLGQVERVTSNKKKKEAAGSVLMKTWRLSKLDALIVYNETNLG